MPEYLTGLATICTALAVAALVGGLVGIMLNLCAGAGGFYLAYRTLKEW